MEQQQSANQQHQSFKLTSPAKQKRPKKEWKDMSAGERFAGITFLAIGAVIVLWILSAIGHSFSSQPTSSTTNSPQNQTQPAQPTTAQLVTTWNSKYGSIFGTLQTDFSNMSSGGTDPTTVNSECMQIQEDVATAQSYPAIPDAQTASDWSSALSYFSNAAQDCIDGTTNYDTSLIQKATSEFSQGNAKLDAASADLKAVANQ